MYEFSMIFVACENLNYINLYTKTITIQEIEIQNRNWSSYQKIKIKIKSGQICGN